ncbi:MULTISPECIES: hypothetical protein [Vibrio]|uniref:Uncharacterized protein n=1 Tax=Vibrio diazotrophicus TaxID=685 RepID=A0A2J8GBF3_VIBDI|nr:MULTISPECIES: hypothetical protein [Vibrio]MCF7362063.1 hypothetical protein [Vibrio sp. A1-b2]MCZ4370305.1 hypothetical protein [Vibrio diazotrophicus]PNH83350.1 hypothetical protein C1N27_01865 [Vibrio diazotrophicus]PNH97295.1 hypothetical protein C1O25_20585 [Vibrio diazotrophicus]PNI06795.1 hypothetical protein C1N32_01970 [Vibrio diazotrophicus]
MLEKVESVMEMNGLEYARSTYSLTAKFSYGIGSVKIRYDPATNTYLYSGCEKVIWVGCFILFCVSFNMMLHPSDYILAGYLAGMMFASAMLSFFQQVLLHIQMLDIKAQLRGEGIYLKLG